jgi:hypothetical protein
MRGRSRRDPRRCRSRLQLLQLLFERSIPVLQFFILPGQRSQLLFQLLNAEFRIDVVLCGSI